MNGITLRVFSGIHRGAEIALTEGTYVFGTDDSCDIILADSSLTPRHAALQVSSGEQGVHVVLTPLDGQISFSGEVLNQEFSVPARRPFSIGLVAFAWDDAPSAEAWQEVEEAISSSALPSPSAGENAAPHSEEEQPSDLPSEGEENPAISSAEEPLQDPPAKSCRKYAGKAGILLALLLTGALTLTWSDPVQGPAPEEQTRYLLEEAGYKDLLVRRTKNGVVISGRIASDQERGRLLRLAQLLDFPAYLNVTVHSDAADAVRASFNAAGLYPEVKELPPSEHPGLIVRGYIKNGVLEEHALSEAIRNIPELQPSGTDGRPKLALFRKICHESDVKELLLPALAQTDLANVKPEYLPGRIALHGAFTPQTRTSLEEALAGIEKKLDIPIIFDIINDSEVLYLAKSNNIYSREEKNISSSAASRNDSAYPFHVTSVSMGALKFITLSGGERIFEGGELPGGYRLENISVDTLTLNRNNATYTYPLRGSHE